MYSTKYRSPTIVNINKISTASNFSQNIKQFILNPQNPYIYKNRGYMLKLIYEELPNIGRSKSSNKYSENSSNRIPSNEYTQSYSTIRKLRNHIMNSSVGVISVDQKGNTEKYIKNAANLSLTGISKGLHKLQDKSRIKTQYKTAQNLQNNIDNSKVTQSLKIFERGK